MGIEVQAVENFFLFMNSFVFLYVKLASACKQKHLHFFCT
jgi:hypothetical protein